jgi:hypothetical protein
MPNLTIDLFRAAFDKAVSEQKISWEVVGFYGADGRIYPFGTDTKVLSTVFEALAAPLIGVIAKAHGYEVESSEQTVYPDFTLSPNGKPARIAIDIKTTYRRFNQAGKTRPFMYTLGSYTSFLRDGRKNISHPYEEYEAHWVVGFLYTRRAGVAAKVYYRPEEVNVRLCPYKDVEYFIQEKYKIAGEAVGSGNTANIGSFPTADIRDLRDGKGPFAKFGAKVCDDYWSGYSKSKVERAYDNLEAFLARLKS